MNLIMILQESDMKKIIKTTLISMFLLYLVGVGACSAFFYFKGCYSVPFYEVEQCVKKAVGYKGEEQ